MNSFEFNKIVGAVLATIFVLFGGSILAEGLFHSEAPETPGYEIVAAEPEADGAGGEAAKAEEVPIAVLLQSADAEAGAGQFKKCGACHSGDKDGKNGAGPVLWDVVNRPIASVADFAYSSGMKEFSQGGSVNWDYEHLNGFLTNPKGYVAGTSMGFAGLKDPEARAELIAYLRTLSDNPAPLPEAPAEEAPADAAAPAEAAAEGAAPAETAAADPATTTQPEEATNGAQAPAVTETEAAQAAPGAEAAQTQAAGGEAQAPATETPAEAEAAPAAPAVPAEAAAPDAAAQPTTEAAPAAAEQPAEPAAEQPAAEAAPAAEQPAQPEAAAPAEPAAAAPTQTASVAGDAEAGKGVFRKCQACHAVGEGAKNKLGPELNGIVGEKIAAVEGYSFSGALTEYAAAHPTWTVEELTTWLTDPKGTVPGTKMSFPGLKKPEDVANVIAYLATFDENGAQTGN